LSLAALVELAAMATLMELTPMARLPALAAMAWRSLAKYGQRK